MIASMNDSIADDRLPLSALLSQALVAFTIEFDNEFEHCTPHQTTTHARTRGAPWLVSMVMWAKFLRFVPQEGITVRDLQLCSRTSGKELQLWLTRLIRWWRYLALDPPNKTGPAKRIAADAIVRPTPGGRVALDVWRPLTGTIENRWQERFGLKTTEGLRDSLSAFAAQLDPDLPDSLPVLGYGLFSSAPESPASSQCPVAAETSLPGLLSKVLLAFAIEFERESELSLAIAANVLRLVGDDGVPIKDLPRRSGVSKEAIAMAVSYLEKRGFAIITPQAPGSRVKSLALTVRGRMAQQKCRELIAEIEPRWRSRYGIDKVQPVREALEKLAGKPGPEPSALMAGLRPYPDCWRAAIPVPEVLPHYPMVLHRGGFPDGS
jgi:DNA-binding MarR family transcriptional regulator